MPCLTGNFNPAQGVILQVGITAGGQLQQLQAAQQKAQSGNPGPNVTVTGAQANGLVDTGADQTSISPKLAQHLSLKPQGKINVQGATGAKPANTYYVDFALSFGADALALPNLHVMEFDPGNAAFDVLIGRDVICKGVLTLDFTGHFSFSI